MARFFSDENVPLEVVRVLRSLGHDVLTAFEAGQANRNTQDDEVLRFAVEEKRAVLTLNRLDFHRLHRLTKGAHNGIVTCTRGKGMRHEGECMRGRRKAEGMRHEGKGMRHEANGQRTENRWRRMEIGDQRRRSFLALFSVVRER
jgi:predicted nuclease of predicted toxin-antitoxin system